MVTGFALRTGEMSVSLKLKPLECLPAQGVQAVEFKVWRNRLTAFLEQDLTTVCFSREGNTRNGLLLMKSLTEEESETSSERVMIRTKYWKQSSINSEMG